MASKPHARAARRTSRRIDEVDGVLTTHTQPSQVHAWKVTDGPDNAAPLPFAAKKAIPATVAVPIMVTLVLMATATALLTILDGNPDQSLLMAAAFALLGLWSVALVIQRLTLPPTTTDARRQRRRVSAKAQRLIAQQCADLEEAARIVQCGRAAFSTSGVILKRTADGLVYPSGVVTCGSPWSCLRCSYKIRAKRARQIALAVAAHIASGGGVLFGTFTMSHDRGEDLDQLWEILSQGWAYMTSGRQWVDFRNTFGLVGSIKSVEVTHGANGWHPHLHVLFFIDAPMNDFDREHNYREFRRSLRTRWIRWFARKQNRNVSQEFGTRFDPVKPDESELVGTYCTKVGYELAMADSKIGRQDGQRHPFAIAHDAASYGDMADVMLLREWVVGSKRRKSIQWSGDQVKAYVAHEVDKTDDELAAEEQIGDEALLVVERDLWQRLISRTDGARADFLQLFEDGGDTFDALYFLAELGITAEIAEDGPLAMLRLNQANHQPTPVQED